MSEVRNAYVDPRKISPGCQHLLGCKCETPFWLRDPTPRELEFESRVLQIAPLARHGD
jgi:hypothetical protein